MEVAFAAVLRVARRMASAGISRTEGRADQIHAPRQVRVDFFHHRDLLETVGRGAKPGQQAGEQEPKPQLDAEPDRFLGHGYFSMQ